MSTPETAIPFSSLTRELAKGELDLKARRARLIKQAKREHGLTWREIAEVCGVHYITALRWGTGQHVPTTAHLAALDRIFATHALPKNRQREKK